MQCCSQLAGGLGLASQLSGLTFSLALGSVRRRGTNVTGHYLSLLERFYTGAVGGEGALGSTVPVVYACRLVAPLLGPDKHHRLCNYSLRLAIAGEWRNLLVSTSSVPCSA